MAAYADGRTEAVDVTGPVVVEIDGRDTLEEALILGDEVLIGQTVLEKLDLFVDSRRQRLIPNPYAPLPHLRRYGC
jgi:predicted aspartyl protease